MKVLVLSGGGSKGAFQVGVLQHLAKTEELDYDGYCGISVGALNSGFLAMYPTTKEAIEPLTQMWLGLKTKDIHKRWFPFGKLHGLWEPSLFNSAPLRETCERLFDYQKIIQSGKRLTVGAVSLTDGGYWYWDEKDPEILEGILASSSYPIMFSPIKKENELWTDGGVRDVIPLKNAIEMGATEIDVITCAVPGGFSQLKSKPNAINVAVRSLEVMMDEIIHNDIHTADGYNKLIREMGANYTGDKKVLKIRVFIPATPLDFDSLSFENKEISQMIKIGNEAIHYEV